MDAVLNLLGLARRAGRMAIGEETVAAAVRSGEARLLVLSSDASEHLVRRAEHFDMPVLRLTADKLTLGCALGKSTCGIAAITDSGLAASAAEKGGAPDAVVQVLRARVEREKQRDPARPRPCRRKKQDQN